MRARGVLWSDGRCGEGKKVEWVWKWQWRQ